MVNGFEGVSCFLGYASLVSCPSTFFLQCLLSSTQLILYHQVNAVLKKHNRAVFSSQAIHHVARQIESLYWNSIDPESNGELSQGLVVEKGTDLTNSRYEINLLVHDLCMYADAVRRCCQLTRAKQKEYRSTPREMER